MKYIHGYMAFSESQLAGGQPFGDGLRLHAKLDREEAELIASALRSMSDEPATGCPESAERRLYP